MFTKQLCFHNWTLCNSTLILDSQLGKLHIQNVGEMAFSSGDVLYLYCVDIIIGTITAAFAVVPILFCCQMNRTIEKRCS